MVLAQILKPVLVRARERKVWLPVRPVTRRHWPNGHVTHEELRPLKMLAVAAAVPVPQSRAVRRRPAAGAGHAGGVVGRGGAHPRGAHRADRARGAGLRRCRRPADVAGDLQRAEARQGKGYQARELGVPLVSDAEFMSLLERVVGGTGIEEFTDTTLAGEQFTLF